MIKVLIVDDEQHCINAIANLIEEQLGFLICGTAKTVEVAIEKTVILKPDLVFLDIALGSKTGFDYLNAFLPTLDFEVVFITAFDQFAVKAFEYSALHYLLKPVSLVDLKKALGRMEIKISQEERLERFSSLAFNFQQEEVTKLLHVSTFNNYQKIHTRTIKFVKADSNYSEIHLTNGGKILSAKTLKYYIGLLSDTHFYQVNKSYMVNTFEMKFYKQKSRTLFLKDNTTIIVSVRRQKEFLNTIFRKR